MRLCNYTVKIEIPDDFTLQKQDRALDAIDNLDLPRLIARWHNDTNARCPCSDGGFGPPMLCVVAGEANACEAERHHRPSRNFRDLRYDCSPVVECIAPALAGSESVRRSVAP